MPQDTAIPAQVTSFYVVGGTLQRDAPSYVPRQADNDLLEGLLSGQFCYVLTSRQMGKSSLMIRTAVRLREQGVAVAVLDLTAIGQNLTPEQWYDGLLNQVGQQLHLEDELDDFWLDHARMGLLQRWIRAIREVVLERVPGKVVLFIDEVDVVRSLPFSADEFFAGIRECYNRRAEDSAFERLTFGLFGVATPSDLIRDTRTTPFNIGKRIELRDFTEAEAAPLAKGLSKPGTTGEALLRRILYWTGGHPYLTQRMCRALAEEPRTASVAEVDRLCEDLFFTPRARETDDNLLFVRERLLRSEAPLASVLDLYGKVRTGARLKDDETNPLVSLLRLSGITRVVAGVLQVRNRIYARVFDREWVRANMPDAELRRQRAAARRARRQVGLIAGIVVSLLTGLLWKAVTETNRARTLLAEAYQERGIGMMEQGDARGLLYLLAAKKTRVKDSKLAGWYAYYADLFAGATQQTGFPTGMDPMRSVSRMLPVQNGGRAFSVPRLSQDGKRLFNFVARDGAASLAQQWDTHSGRLLRTTEAAHKGRWVGTEISPDSRWRAIVSIDHTDPLYAMRMADLWIPTETAPGFEFSDAGTALNKPHLKKPQWILTLLDETTGQTGVVSLPTGEALSAIAFRPDSARLAGALVQLPSEAERRSNPDSYTTRIVQWDPATRRPYGPTISVKGIVHALVYRPGGARLRAMVGNVVQDFDVPTGNPVASARTQISTVPARYRFACDGDYLYQISNSGQISSSAGTVTTTGLTVWNTRTGRGLAVPQNLRGQATTAAFSTDGKWAAVAVVEGHTAPESTVLIWDTTTEQASQEVIRTKGIVKAMEFLPEGTLAVVVAQSQALALWRLPSVPLPLHEMELRTGFMLKYRLDQEGRLEEIPNEDWIDVREELREWEKTHPPRVAREGNLQDQVNERIVALEKQLQERPDDLNACNDLAWYYATAPEGIRDPQKGLPLIQKALRRDPKNGIHLNTQGVLYYRLGLYEQAFAALNRSLKASSGQYDAHNLFFLAMCAHKKGDRTGARAYYDRAIRWCAAHLSLSKEWKEELAAFRKEAEAVLQKKDNHNEQTEGKRN